MLFIETLFDDPVTYLSVIVVVILSIVLHELGHGFAALYEGDTTPEDTGHMDLNPMTHMGGMALAALFLVGISWGMMPVNPRRFRHGRQGEALVAFAGPLVNLWLMGMFALLLVLWEAHGASLTHNPNLLRNLSTFFNIGAVWNGVLFLLNMIPVPPLDGFTVFSSLSSTFRGFADPIRQYGMMIFLVIFFFGGSILFRGAHIMAGFTIHILSALGA